MDVGLLVLRIVIGLLFVGHGTQKLFGWFGGYGLGAVGGWLESMGYRPGRRFALLLGLTEAGAGLLLAAGFATPLAAAGIVGVMIHAALVVNRSKGLFGGYELDVVMASAATALAFAGAGSYSADAGHGWDLTGAEWGLGALGLAVAAATVAVALRRAAVAEESETVADEERRAA